MSEVSEERRFSLFNADGRNNKFWNIALYSDGTVEVHFGSQGQLGQKKTYLPPHPKSGKSGFNTQIKSKTNPRHKGGAYIENKVLDTGKSAPVSVASTHALREVAVRDIAKGNKELSQLISYFTEVNAHNLFEASGGRITLDIHSGLFRTPQGVITLDQIHHARSLLNQIANLTSQDVFSGDQFNCLVNHYLSLIPQKGLVRKMNFSLMFNFQGLRHQGDMLDALETSYTSAFNTPLKTKSEQKETPLFKVDLSLVEGGSSEWKQVRNLYHKTKGSHTDVASYDVHNVFNLRIEHMAVAFLRKGVRVGNVMRLWHGTKASNVLSILKGGMVVPPASSPHVTARLFGDGLYFSDQSTKSIRYATGAWTGGGRTDRKFMFLVDVAMGKPHYPTEKITRIPAGYDSCFAEGGRVVSDCYTGRKLLNNEMIVYCVEQVNPVYLVECANKH